MIQRHWLCIGDIVRINDALSFPRSYQQIGRVVRDRFSGLYDVETELGRSTVYRNEVDILAQECVDCSGQVYSPIRGRCLECFEAHNDVA